MAPCPKCGNPLPENAKFCGQCGTVIGATPAPPPQPARAPAAMTMIGVASPLGPAQAPAPAQAQAQGGQLGARTMLGFVMPPGAIPPAAPHHAQPAPQPQALPPQAPPPQQAPPAAPAPSFANKTMLGVAVPGIAPTQAAPPAQQPQQPPAKMAAASRTMLGVAVPGIAPIREATPGRLPASQTMLGVAAPGIAPINAGVEARPRASYEPPPPVIPAPAPLYHEPLPEAPIAAPKKGVPLAVVAGVVGAILLIGAGIIALAFRAASPLTATPQLSAEGKEQLHLVCQGCKDGTVASLDGATTTFTQHQADLDLTKSLRVGDNAIAITLDRPGMGRDEQVKLVVAVAYRIRPDLSKIDATPPAIQILIEAVPGDTVELDGKPVTLDGTGKATVAIDISSEVSGEGDAKTIDKKLAYSLTNKKGEKSAGNVSAKVGVLPLHLDAPGLRATTDQPSINVAGRTAKGGQVTINGAVATVGDDGAFGVRAPVPSGDNPTLVVRALSKSAAGSAPRVIQIPVKRVQSLPAEAAVLEKAAALGFDAISGDPAAVAGQAIIVEGSILEARAQNHGTVMVVDDRRGCAKSPCVVRVLYGGETAVGTGDWVRVYGQVHGAFVSPDGTKVPEVTADFLLKGKK